MYWVNLAKKIMSFENSPPRLVFFALAILLENLRLFLASEVKVEVNWTHKICFPKYMELRDLQKWEMSEYTKRLPGFLERSRNKITDFMKNLSKGKNMFMEADRSEKVARVFLKELALSVEERYISGSSDEQVPVFLKVKPFYSANLSLKLTSSIFSEKTLGLILKKMLLQIENHKMYKKTMGIFKLEVIHSENPDDGIYENLKRIVD